MEKFEHFLPLVEQGIEQADRRVLRGERLPATEKLLSLFEEHTQIITRHKPGKPREFGRKIVLDEVDGGIISRYEVLPESASERSELSASLKAHQQRFGRAPYLLAGDRGLYSVENERVAHQAGVERVVLPKSGKLSEKRRHYEKHRWFRRGFRFRAGIEGRISVLGRAFGLDVMPRSWRRRDAEVGRMGDSGPQPEADCPNAGRAPSRMRPRELKGAARRASRELYP